MLHRQRLKTSAASALNLHPPGYGVATLSVSAAIMAGHDCISDAVWGAVYAVPCCYGQ